MDKLSQSIRNLVLKGYQKHIGTKRTAIDQGLVDAITTEINQAVFTAILLHSSLGSGELNAFLQTWRNGNEEGSPPSS